MNGPVPSLQLAVAVLAGVMLSKTSPARAQSVPSIDTEDASLGSTSVTSTGWLHPSIGIDLRNGDFARGNYDDDPADLDRLPVHVQIGAAAEIGHRADGQATTWLVARSSNGFHSPSGAERTSPRAWYESNNLVALVTTPAAGLRAGVVYTIKTSPNDVSGTTHEASLTAAYSGKDAIGRWRPTFAATKRTRGDGGFYTQVGVRRRVVGGDDSPVTLSIPAVIGIGWDGFYGARSGNRVYGNVGATAEHSFRAGGVAWTVRGEMLALIRDRRLARLSGPLGETGTVVPLATVALSVAY